MNTKKTRTGYRDADNGEFITKKEFDIRPAREVIKERVPLPGRGDTK